MEQEKYIADQLRELRTAMEEVQKKIDQNLTVCIEEIPSVWQGEAAFRYTQKGKEVIFELSEVMKNMWEIEKHLEAGCQKG